MTLYQLKGLVPEYDNLLWSVSKREKKSSTGCFVVFLILIVLLIFIYASLPQGGNGGRNIIEAIFHGLFYGIISHFIGGFIIVLMLLGGLALFFETKDHPQDLAAQRLLIFYGITKDKVILFHSNKWLRIAHSEIKSISVEITKAGWAVCVFEKKGGDKISFLGISRDEVEKGKAIIEDLIQQL